MSDFFTTFAGDLPPWLLLLVVPLFFWGKTVKSGLDPSNKASFERTIRWLREEHIEQLYLSALGGLMDGVGKLIGDRHKMGQSYTTTTTSTGLTTKLFGFNPFTPESYEKCVLLALLYPILSFLFAWMIGANGNVGDIYFLKMGTPLSLAERSILLMVTLGLAIGTAWLVSKYSGWWKWLCLAALLGLLNSASSFFTKTIFIEATQNSALIFFIIFFLIYIGGELTGFIVHRSLSKAHSVIYRPAFTIASAIAVAATVAGTAIVADVAGAAGVAGAGAGNAAVVVALVAAVLVVAVVGGAVGAVAAIVVAAAFADTVAVAVALAVAVAAVGASLVIMQTTQAWCLRRSRLFWYWFLYTIIFFILGLCTLYIVKEEDLMVLLLLWLLLPLVNAPLDWLSLGVTRGLLQAVRSAKHSTYTVLAWAVMDLVLALVFLFLITAVLVGVTALGDTIAGKVLVDIHSILAGIKETPAAVDHWWIYFMLLSTLAPTLIHFALAGGAATLWLPRKIRLKIADGLEHDSYKTQLAWVYLTFTPIIGFILMPAALLYGLYWIITVNGASIGWILFDWAQSLADFAGGVSSTGKPSP